MSDAPDRIIDAFGVWYEAVPWTGCWLWTRTTDKNGYGQISIGGKVVRAHRVMYGLCYGSIPDGMVIMHKCDEPSCVNPAHLSMGTQSDNLKDCAVKNRMHPGERHGMAKLTEEQAQWILDNRDEYAQRELAGMFGVTQHSISRLISGERWRHLHRDSDPCGGRIVIEEDT